MYDLRNYKELVKDTVKDVNEKANWKWTAIVNKNEIKLTNGYIKGEYTGDCKDYFSIKVYDDEDLKCVEGTDCLFEHFAYRFVGSHHWEDGTIEDCIKSAIKSANSYFESRY